MPKLQSRLFAALAICAVAAAAVAQPRPPRPMPPGARVSIITNPDWDQIPSAEDLTAAYPPAAAQAGLGGRVILECLVTAKGTLTRCSVLEETPEGQGFGAAAMTLSQKFLMRPMTRDGRAVSGGRVRIPIRFQA